MSGKDIKTICLKLESLHEKILKSKFAEQVYESEMISLILAIGELEKQIPRKPINRKGTTYFHCPVCEGNMLNDYCADCGQALDWSDTE